MTDTLHRIVYESTVDDALDVAWRFSSRTRAFQKQVRQNVVIAGAVVGLAAIAAFVFAGAVDTRSLAMAIAGGTAFAVLFGWLYKAFLLKEARKNHRQVIAEQFGSKPTTTCEVELRPVAVWVRQGEIEMLFPWRISTGVLDNAHDIEMNFAPGICVIRNAHFASPADRQAFLETARRLSANAATATSPTTAP
jgi:hypothetical protein